MSENNVGSLASDVGAILRGEKPATVKPEAPVTAKDETHGDVVDQLSEVLRGESRPEEREEAATQENQPMSLDSLAEKLGVEVAELYSMQIGMPDGGEAMTLSDLKDLATERQRDVAERLEWEGEKSKERNRLQNERSEMQKVLSLIPSQFRSPELLSQARDAIDKERQIEAARLVDRVPEWRDPKAFAADMETITPHIGEFGFSKEELRSVYDHRLLAYIRHNALREKRLSEVLAEARERRERKGSARTGGAKPTQKGVTPALTSKAAKVGAVTQLLNKG